MSAFDAQPPSESSAAVPRSGNRADLRIDDAARQEVSRLLGRHLADGRLDMLEYEDRLERTMAARKQSDLAGILDDLPALDADGRPAVVEPPVDPSAARRRAAAKSMIVGWLTLALFFTMIWAVTDFGGYFWPVWPIMGTGLGVIPGAYAVWNGTKEPDEDDGSWF
ncbi:DUF1707 SHOCT-like domain-containing protein [Euzebya tangerina]|uniref:DUF1707 SHOCT-like domain-containing protein n=1 Tax=Euzebya tangerina TaxID=591198 RepID=UPI000E31F4B4|nr:DUF1707 domain-containing protein [Euzebya tangerina]